MTLTETEKAYIAGIIDGEGCIYLTKSQNSNACSTSLSVRIANTNIKLINWLKEKVGTDPNIYNQVPKNERRKVTYYISWRGNDATSLLDKVYPYLVIKKEQAELVFKLNRANNICFRMGCTQFSRSNPVPKKLVEYRQRIYAKLNQLNRRGEVSK